MPINFRKSEIETRWASFENLSAGRGQGGQSNQGHKGHAYESVAPGETKTLLDVQGNGTIRRIWLTVTDRSPKMLRSLRLDMYWDGASQPAVSAPLGDFFGLGLRRGVRFENELFSDPEGRSFNCYIPMPFRRSARVTLTNESGQRVPHLFYDIDCTLNDGHDADSLYFHCHWRRERPTGLAKDFEILPAVRGQGYYLGANLGVITDPIYENAWWGEGEVKIYLDSDLDNSRPLPTLNGTGTEDYIGTAWGQKVFAHRYQGCLVSGEQRNWAFYRYHVPDPVAFRAACRVTIQSMGGWDKADLLRIKQAGAPVILVATDKVGVYTKAFEQEPPLQVEDPSIEPTTWCNFYRQDDWSATAYFYLDAPQNDLPPLADVSQRTVGLMEDPEALKRADA